MKKYHYLNYIRLKMLKSSILFNYYLKWHCIVQLKGYKIIPPYNKAYEILYSIYQQYKPFFLLINVFHEVLSIIYNNIRKFSKIYGVIFAVIFLIFLSKKLDSLSHLRRLFMFIYEQQSAKPYGIKDSTKSMLFWISRFFNDGNGIYSSVILLYYIPIFIFCRIYIFHDKIKWITYMCHVLKFIAEQILQIITIYSISLGCLSLIFKYPSLVSTILVHIQKISFMALAIETMTYFYLLINNKDCYLPKNSSYSSYRVQKFVYFVFFILILLFNTLNFGLSIPYL